ncbi:MAG: YdcF family protein [Anaerolineae bacterium]|nr:YdcF family protein [Anaerolineae bacterium]
MLVLAAHLLQVDQDPVAADAIFVLGGGDGSRLRLGAELYHQGYAPLMLTSGKAPALPGFDTPFAELAATYLPSLGVPRDHIVPLSNTTSTYEDAIAAHNLSQARNWLALLVITDAYHTQRARLTFRHVFRDSDTEIVIVASQPEWYHPSDWWRHEKALLVVLQEYGKLAYYAYKGRIP